MCCKYKLEQRDFSSLSEDEMDAHLAHYYRLREENFPFYPAEPWDIRRHYLLSPPVEETIYQYLIYVGNKIVGYAALGFVNESSPEYELKRDISTIHISLDKEYRQKGIGTQIFNHLKELSLSLERKKIHIWTPNFDGKQFCQKKGGKSIYEHSKKILLLDNVDWKKMSEWIKLGKENASDVILEHYTGIPEKDLKEFTALYTEVMNQSLDEEEIYDIVTPESWRKAEIYLEQAEKTKHIMITREKDGTISGLTEVIYNKKNNKVLQQDLTGVKKEYRGRGLGKLLKSSMLFYIRETYPQVELISTGNATTNTTMYHINAEIGFEEKAIVSLYEFLLS